MKWAGIGLDGDGIRGYFLLLRYESHWENGMRLE
jgi:hypothetical protein